MVIGAIHPYCGAPPTPSELLGDWKLDPILLTVLVAILAAYGVGSLTPAAGRSVRNWRRWAFAGGWLIAALSLTSPLCPLSVALFSARVGQHMILSLVAAPLVLLGRPGIVLGSLLPGAAHWLSSSRTIGKLRSGVVSTLAFMAALWFWHAPGPYEATFDNPAIYWAMHLSIFGSALLVWNALLDARPQKTISTLAVGAAATLQMTLLGAVITLTPHMLYSPHILTPLAWGMTQASDQQLGGLLMWVPGGGIFLIFTLLTLGRVMGESPQPRVSV